MTFADMFPEPVTCREPVIDDARVAEGLREWFGFGQFRPGQADIVRDVLGESATVAVMPTGAGKSLCYQLPALLLDGLTLVVSPLIALMKDQVDALRGRGLPAAALNSSQSLDERRETLDAARAGRLKLLYVAPERFRDAAFLGVLDRAPLALLAVDEAHCISQWGHDFRPDYLQLGEIVAHREIPRVAAFTATATSEVRDDIATQLGMRHPAVHVTGFARPNLHLRAMVVRRMREKHDHVLGLLARTDGQGIVYVATRRHAEEEAQRLRADGHAAAVYHGGMEDDARRAAQDRFMAGAARVMVATNAFGMGVDKSDLRFVVHYDVPGSVEAYYQEAGRAGRDGAPAECVLLFTYADVRIQETLIQRDRDDHEVPTDGRPPRPRPDPTVVAATRERDLTKLRRMVRYAYTEDCRHHFILRYFGDPEARTVGSCEACDVCGHASPWEDEGPARPRASAATARRGAAPHPAVAAAGLAPRDLTDEEALVVRKVLSAVARVRGELSVTDLVRLLRGSEAGKARESRWAGSPSDGLLRGTKHGTLRELIVALETAGCLCRAPQLGLNRVLLTHRGRAAMLGEEAVRLALAPIARRSRRSTAADAPDCDPELFERLRAARLELARERDVAAFLICGDRTLRGIAASGAQSREDLLRVTGVGETNVQVFGATFLAVLRDASRET